MCDFLLVGTKIHFFSKELKFRIRYYNLTRIMY